MRDRRTICFWRLFQRADEVMFPTTFFSGYSACVERARCVTWLVAQFVVVRTHAAVLFELDEEVTRGQPERARASLMRRSLVGQQTF